MSGDERRSCHHCDSADTIKNSTDMTTDNDNDECIDNDDWSPDEEDGAVGNDVTTSEN